MKFKVFYNTERFAFLQDRVLEGSPICRVLGYYFFLHFLKKKPIVGNDFPSTNVTKCRKKQYIFNTTCVSHTICGTW